MYKKFIGNFSYINEPVLETIRKSNQPFVWTKEVEKSFQTLKKKVSEKLVLVLPDFKKPFQVRCDASGKSIGAILSQDDRPVSYFNEKLNDAKQKYSSHYQKLYAIVQELKKWRHYLMSGEFVLYTDNHTL